MAPLEGSRLTHGMKRRTIFPADEGAGLMGRQEGISYYPYVGTEIDEGQSIYEISTADPMVPPGFAPSTAEPVPESSMVLHPPMNTLAAPQSRAPPVPTPMSTSTAVGDQESDPTVIAPPARAQSGDTGNTETTTGVPTTIVTSGAHTITYTTTLPDGGTTVVVTPTTGVYTVTRTIAVPTQIGTVSSKSGPPAGIIGGIIGATIIMIMVLIVVCIVRHKHRHMNSPSRFASNTGPPSTLGAKFTIPRPFLGTLPPHEQFAEKKEKDQLESPQPLPYHSPANDSDGDNIDPFRDPEITQGQEEPPVRVRNALDRLHELTREVEEELRELGNRARCGQLVDCERDRLDEIRHTTGLAIVYDPGYVRIPTTSSTTSYTTSPPSYHSGGN